MSGLILIVEDERDLVATLEFAFQRAGYETRTALAGNAALEEACREPRPDVVLLDLMLPDISGTEVCRQLRQDPRTRDIGIIMLTAKGEEIDRVVGLEVGADDYVVKPYSPRELLLRVQAVLRRIQARERPSTGGEMTFGLLRVDPSAHRVYVGDAPIELTALEFKLLTTLLSRRGRVQTRERLLQDVWEMRADITTRTVDTHVKRLRQKLGSAGAYIETLRGVGYRFTDQPVEPQS